eukprot:c29401_g2_i1 orf=157-378(-)
MACEFFVRWHMADVRTMLMRTRRLENTKLYCPLPMQSSYMMKFIAPGRTKQRNSSKKHSRSKVLSNCPCRLED